jgi:hypothetical protein
MAGVIARVELHFANYTDYETLHTAMQREGFQRVVRANDGVWYHLPTGTYVHTVVSNRL